MASHRQPHAPRQRAGKQFGEIPGLVVSLYRGEQQLDRPLRGEPFRFQRIGQTQAANHQVGLCSPTPIQLPLFAETASLVRIRPALHEWRYYRMEIWPDLFGRALLVRQWGRIGTEGRRRLDPYPDPGAAINALAALLRAKRRRGYQDRTG